MKSALEIRLKEIEQFIPDFKTQNDSVSSASVGWHLLHSLKVINMITEALQKSEHEPFKKQFNLLKLILFNWGKFPRGARAPKRVKPKMEEIHKPNIIEQLNASKTSIQLLEELPKHAFIEHPKFGKLNTQESIKFLCIHTKHHLKIVVDILKDS